MSKKQDKNQLQLDFESAQQSMKDAVDRFGEAAKKLAMSLDGGNPETQAMMDDEQKEIRRSINRLVGVLADQSGLPFHAVWVLAYHEHYQRTGFHAVSVSKGKGTHLDAIAREGQLPSLQETVVEMMTKPEFHHKP